ncbi:hypothetical protein L195_g019536 [Trifolium pratense]|uniref:Reverse transcriptase zinc-binding domain-containing protein n=1 Tax=Trifolium pratense TaxID=57577 RepID=A0A2K3MZY7_TRIPR|nr:hypothetical protein L195_g019536 [Trifolium pratense]
MQQMNIISSSLSEFCDASGAKVSVEKTKMLVSSNVNGRITLTQSVLAALPTYVMQTTILPQGICNKIEKLMRNFIWGSTDEKRSWHTVAWDNICKPKDQGEFSKRNTNAGRTQFLKSRPHNFCSSTWRAIVSVKETMIEIMQWNIGNGRTIQFWSDTWLPSRIVLNEVTRQQINQTLANKTVEYFSDNNGNWTLQEVLHLLPDHVIEQIRWCTAASDHLGEDKLSWPYSSNGTFSVKSAYELLLNITALGRIFWNNVWKWEGPQKIMCFLWLVINDGLKTNDKRCWLSTQSNCPLYLTESEKAIHLLRDCELVKPIWQHFGFVFYRRDHEIMMT